MILKLLRIKWRLQDRDIQLMPLLKIMSAKSILSSTKVHGKLVSMY
jgi:hypothetical protein